MNTIFRCVGILVICFALQIPTASATLEIEVDITCPLCGAESSYPKRFSQFRTGMRLDLKPLGPKGPPPLPVCPSCHFVIYEENLPEAEKQIFSKYVRSEDYQRLSKDWPSYYLLAKLFEQVKGEDVSIANAYLKASWQVEDDPERCRHCLHKSLEYLDRYLIYPGTYNEEWPTLQALAGELERRLGEFVRAKNRFMMLSRMPQFQGNILEEIVRFQLKLIEAKDKEPHALFEMEQSDK
ncbi:MAG: hypothetical protein JW836_10695 [Deltaproteobacteria bacterium]|nr:hypothetical protein [Deltaproteobacteria bacterium]